MKLTFLGATHEVTGSCYYLEACGKKILIDCGMEQGKDCFVNQPIPVDAEQIDMVFLTHAHIDHSGKLPLLAKQGFQGQIFSTEGTEQLSQIMLMDSAHIQESEAEWKNRKNLRAGRPLIEPMYDSEDAKAALKCFIGVPYEEERIVAEGIRIRFVDAGHLLGSASIIIDIEEEGVQKRIVFSGDIGNTDQPLIEDPTYIREADYVVIESTYAGRMHEARVNYTKALAGVLQETFDHGGNVVIPSFAVGRTQEMLYFLRTIKEEDMVKGHPGFEVFVDSPLAIEATGVFMKRMYSDFDAEAEALIREGINPISFDGLKLAVTVDDSRAINDNPRSKVIISSSGMCEAGRIRHHLKHNLYRRESTILFVGYQAGGTLGRYLIDGAKQVKLFGEEIVVNAKIMQLPGVSGHADEGGLRRWLAAFETQPIVFCTHGEDESVQRMQQIAAEEMNLTAYAPYSGMVYDLASGEVLHQGARIPIEQTQQTQQNKQ